MFESVKTSIEQSLTQAETDTTHATISWKARCLVGLCLLATAKGSNNANAYVAKEIILANAPDAFVKELATQDNKKYARPVLNLLNKASSEELSPTSQAAFFNARHDLSAFLGIGDDVGTAEELRRNNP